MDGNTEESLTIDIVSDDVYEGIEQFQVEISVPSADGSISDLGKAPVFIYDDDLPGKFPFMLYNRPIRHVKHYYEILLISEPSMYIFSKQIFYRWHKSNLYLLNMKAI